MIEVKVVAPRSRKASPFMLDERQAVGRAASQIAKQMAYATENATFALAGRQLDPNREVGDMIPPKARIELVLR